jgi:hypothetical protein
LGVALFGRETPHRDTINSSNNLPPDRPIDEARVVSTAYYAWPIAIADRIAPRPESTSWFRFHMHQAFWFGAISFAVGMVALCWPLLASFVVTSVAVTIWLYAVAMLADVGLFVMWLVLAVRYARRSSRGELFDVPWVVRLTGASSRKR